MTINTNTDPHLFVKTYMSSEQILERFNNTCMVCNNVKDDLDTYIVDDTKDPPLITAICEPCYALVRRGDSEETHIVSAENEQKYNLARYNFRDGLGRTKEGLNDMVSILAEEHPDWSIKKIFKTIWIENEDIMGEIGMSINSMYKNLDNRNRQLLDASKQNRIGNNVLEESGPNALDHNVIEDSSEMNAREFTKQQYQRAHRNMSKSEVNKIFEEIPQDLDFDHITNTDLNSALKNAHESVIEKDFEEAETRLKRFDILMKAATKDKKTEQKKPEPKSKNKNIVSRKYELKYKDQTIPLTCLFYYDTESFIITVDE